MNISGEVATIQMKTDAKNVVTTDRTIHLPEQKETIHMISMLRKGACSGNNHDLAHIPIRNSLADRLTMASAQADNLITTVKTERLLNMWMLAKPTFGGGLCSRMHLGNASVSSS